MRLLCLVALVALVALSFPLSSSFDYEESWRIIVAIHWPTSLLWALTVGSQ